MFAGSWYPGTESGLKETIEKCFLSKQGPGELPTHEFWKENKGNVIGIISPHAGYAYSGGVAANGRLRGRLAEEAGRQGIRLHVAPIGLCTDNAVMGAIAVERLQAGLVEDLDLDVCPGVVRKTG